MPRARRRDFPRVQILGRCVGGMQLLRRSCFGVSFLVHTRRTLWNTHGSLNRNADTTCALVDSGACKFQTRAAVIAMSTTSHATSSAPMTCHRSSFGSSAYCPACSMHLKLSLPHCHTARGIGSRVLRDCIVRQRRRSKLPARAQRKPTLR